MRSHHVERVLPYSPEQLFSLVGEVERYPEFVPWITAMSVSNPRGELEGVSLVDAEAQVGFSFMRERFGTSVRRDANDLTIQTNLLSGPFRRLVNNWKFVPHPLGTTVLFDIDFEFKSRMLEAMLAANFGRAVDKLMGCFESRAKALYGPPRAQA